MQNFMMLILTIVRHYFKNISRGHSMQFPFYFVLAFAFLSSEFIPRANEFRASR